MNEEVPEKKGSAITIWTVLFFIIFTATTIKWLREFAFTQDIYNPYILAVGAWIICVLQSLRLPKKQATPSPEKPPSEESSPTKDAIPSK